MNRPLLPDRWETLAPLIDAALDLHSDDRRAFLDSACPNDPSLRAELERLLAECDRAAPILDRGVGALSRLADDGEVLISETIGGQYRIERKVGAGGMATVYLARDLRHARSVAIKVLNPELGAILGAERFLAEIEVTAALQHPNVLPLYDSGTFRGGLYYVMPFIEGESLRDRLARGALPVGEAVAILRGVCKALSCAHAHGVVHRDIKPDNVLLAAHGAIVADFGIAKAVDASSIASAKPETTVGVTVGTPAYMSPEQAAGHRAIDHRSDVYSLGVVAYEMFAGRPPFEGDSQRLLAAHVSEIPVDLSERGSSIPLALTSIVMRCLAKRPADRPQSADDVLRALDDLERTADTDHRAPARRSKRTAAIVASAVAFIVLAVAAGMLLRSRARSGGLNPRRIVVAPFANLTGDTSLNVLGPMFAQGVTNGLETLDSLEVIGLLAALRGSDGAPRKIANVADLRALGVETRAGRVVWGSYTKQGDTLRVQSAVLSAEDGRVELSLDPIRAPASSPMTAIDNVREAVEVAIRATGARRSIGSVGHLPTLAAFREFMTGWEIGSAVDGATAVAGRPGTMKHYVKATQLDSLFVLPYGFIGAHLWNSKRFDEMDSLVRVLEPRRPSFSSFERDLFENLDANAHQDWERDLRAARSLLRRDSTVQYTYLVGMDARMTNRPNEGLAALARKPVSSGVWDRYGGYWAEAGRLNHMLGRYDAVVALTIAGSSRVRPGTQAAAWVFTNGAFALAALGRLQELRSLVDSAVRNWSPGSDGTPSVWYYQISDELRAHGRPREADAYVSNGLAWEASHGEEQAIARRIARRRALGNLLLAAGQVDSARSVWQSMVADSARPGVVEWTRRVQTNEARGYLGMIAARVGDTATAERLMRELDSSATLPHAFGYPLVAEAYIAAWLGRKDEAMRLLTTGYKTGVDFAPAWHSSLGFEPLRDYPPFKEFLKPKG